MPETSTGPALDGLPTRDGFRLRGLDMTRIETFTDAAFAFALTLLVISLEPARTFADLRASLVHIPGFVLSGALLMMFWWGHDQWSRRYGLEDGPTVVLSCLLVFTVLVFVYPLRFMASAFVTWIGWMLGLLELGSGVAGAGVDGAGDINRLFAIYGMGFVAMCVALVLLNLHAWRRREDLALNALERVDTLGELGSWAIVAATGAVSVILALSLPERWAGIPGWVYMTLPVVMPLQSRRVERMRRIAREE
jgi:uncharacterized membrane protein